MYFYMKYPDYKEWMLNRPEEFADTNLQVVQNTTPPNEASVKQGTKEPFLLFQLATAYGKGADLTPPQYTCAYPSCPEASLSLLN